MGTALNQQNTDKDLLQQPTFLPISDRNLVYERRGQPGTFSASVTGPGSNVAIPMPVLAYDFASFGTVFAWDGTNHVLTINQSGVYLFMWKATFVMNTGQPEANFSTFLQFSTNGGSSYNTFGVSTTPVYGLPTASLPAFITSTGFEIIRNVAGYKYRLRAERISGSGAATIYTEYSSLLCLCLIGTPDS